MPLHFVLFIAKNQSPSIVVPQSLAVRDTVDDLILIWTVTPPEEWINRIAYFPI